MRTGIATVSLSGTLEEKLAAAASAGFEGVEIMDADVTSSHLSPRAIGARVRSLGMTVDLFQPIRDVEGVDPESFRRNARRVAAKLDVAAELGAPGVLLCSNVASAVVNDDDLVAGQLHELGELAAARGLTIAYEALAWGRFVSTYDHAWRLAVAADHPAVGTCLDSFHIFAAGSDLKHIARLPAERVIFCQVADARGLSMDPLTWSRHHRLFPGQGVFDLRRFVMTVDSMGYAGPYSLEVFNDIFRQTDAITTAVDGLRSLRYLEQALDPAQALSTNPSAIEHIEISTARPHVVETLLGQLGFAHRPARPDVRGSHWQQGDARITVTTPGTLSAVSAPTITGMVFTVDDPAAASTRAIALLAPRVGRDEDAVAAADHQFIAPDNTGVRFSSAPPDATDPRTGPGSECAPIGIEGVDHVSLTQPWQRFDESVLYYRAVVGLNPQNVLDVPDLHGLVTSQAMENQPGTVRVVLTVDPSGMQAQVNHVPPTHLGLRVTDIFQAAALLEVRGIELLAVPDNYYDDLATQYLLRSDEVDRMRRFGVLYDEDPSGGKYWQLYTKAYGDFFLEFVQRIDQYPGYGASNAPIRRVAQQALSPSADQPPPLYAPGDPVTESVQNRNKRIIDDFRSNSGNVHSEGFGRRLVLVHHLGARTGTEYVTPLVSIRDDEDTWLIAASDGGAPDNPQWYRNLLARPDTKIETPDGVIHVHVDNLAGSARDAAWAQFTSEARNVEYRNFRTYQQKTTRTIPVVALRRNDKNQ